MQTATIDINPVVLPPKQLGAKQLSIGETQSIPIAVNKDFATSKPEQAQDKSDQSSFESILNSLMQNAAGVGKKHEEKAVGLQPHEFAVPIETFAINPSIKPIQLASNTISPTSSPTVDINNLLITSGQSAEDLKSVAVVPTLSNKIADNTFSIAALPAHEVVEDMDELPLPTVQPALKNVENSQPDVQQSIIKDNPQSKISMPLAESSPVPVVREQALVVEPQEDLEFESNADDGEDSQRLGAIKIVPESTHTDLLTAIKPVELKIGNSGEFKRPEAQVIGDKVQKPLGEIAMNFQHHHVDVDKVDAKIASLTSDFADVNIPSEPETFEVAMLDSQQDVEVNHVQGQTQPKIVDPKGERNYAIVAEKFTDKTINSAPAIVEQVGFKVLGGLKENNSDMTIQLFPENMGRVDVKFQTSDLGGSKVTFQAESYATLGQLQNAANEIKEILADNGFSSNLSMEFSLAQQEYPEGKNGAQEQQLAAINDENKVEQEPNYLGEPQVAGSYLIGVDGQDRVNLYV